MKTFILVLRYKKIDKIHEGWNYENITLEAEGLTLAQINNIEKETAVRLRTWDTLCKIHNVIYLG